MMDISNYLSHEDKTASSVRELSVRQRTVLTRLAEGESNGEIGSRLGISPKTVARHRENIMHKLGLRSRAELVKYAVRKGIIRA